MLRKFGLDKKLAAVNSLKNWVRIIFASELGGNERRDQLCEASVPTVEEASWPHVHSFSQMPLGPEAEAPD